MAFTRKRQTRKADDESNEYSDSGHDSDYSDAVKPVKRQKTARKQRTSERKLQAAQPTAGRAKHPVTRHTINRAEPMQMDLLQWYDKVHDKRGMPWRKQYDPTMTAEQRSQRAYEVCPMIPGLVIILTDIIYLKGLDI